VIAPSLVPIKPGEHVKTDRRDAKRLAQYLRAGLLTEVAVPSDEDEALRDLCRNREDARKDLHAARQRLIKFLDRKGYFYTEGTHWTDKHRAWLTSIFFAERVTQWAYQDYMLQVEHLECRLKEIDALLRDIARTEPYREPVEYLCCFRGIDWLTGIILVSELFDPGRFPSARALMGYVGLTPSEESSGEKERRGGLTGSGNRIVRRVVIETAWHQRQSPRIGKPLKQRREGQPTRVIAYADRAMARLSSRYFRLIQKKKHPNIVIVAVARELVGFLWGLLCSGEFVTRTGSCQGLERAA
jgi:transposase